MRLFTKQKNTLKAVYEDDLVGYLRSIGLYDAIVSSKQRCIFCGNKITLNNLEVIVPKGNAVNIVCSNKNCLNQL